MSTSTCRAKNPATCRTHGNPLTNNVNNQLSLTEQIALNLAARKVERDAVYLQEEKERVQDWKNLGFQHPGSKRACTDNSTFRVRSNELFEKLTPEQRHALKIYSSNNYKWINAELYNPGQLTDGDDGLPIGNFTMNSMADNYVEENPTVRQFRETIELLDSAFKHVQKNEAEILYRGQSLSNPGLQSKNVEELHAYVDKNFKLGEEVETPGFLSTSPVAFAAMTYCGAGDKASLNPRNEGILFELKTNKGLDMQSLALYSRESETLLPRGMKWRVVAVHKSKKIRAEDKTGFSRNRSAKVTLIQLEEVV